MNTSLDELPLVFGEVEKCTDMWLTLTNLCNLHCKYCFNYVSRCHEHMTPALTIGILNAHLQSFDSALGKPLYINYFGGEPTLNYEALTQITDYIADNDINCEQCLLSNGVFGSRMLAQLANKNIDFQISFDGRENNLRFNKNLSKEIYDQTVQTIKALVKANERVVIRSTIHHDNVGNLTDLVRFCDQYQVKKLKIAPICDFGDVKTFQIQQPDLDAYLENYVQAYELAQQLGVHFQPQGKSYLTAMIKMNIPFVWLPDGTVAMTITYATSKAKGAETIIIGRYEQESGKILVNHDRINEMKNNFIRNKEHYCSDCPIKEICRGNIQFTPFATDTFVPERDNYFCKLGIKMVEQFPE